MDEVAFVESLFAPEMRSASSLFPSLPPNSLLGGGIALAHLPAFQPPPEDAPLFVRLNEDDMFSQMLNDQDFPDFQHFKKEAPAPPQQDRPPSSTNSLLLEPLDLPRSADPSLKDAFYGVAESPRSSPMHFHQQFRGSASSSSGPTRSGICSNGNVTANQGFCLDSNMMPVFPLQAQQGYYTGGYSANFPPLSPATSAWMQQDADISTPGSSSFQRVHTMKHLVAMAGLGMSASAMMPQHLPSPGSVDMFNPGAMATSQSATSSPLWISTSRGSEPEAPMSENAGERKASMVKALDAIKTSVERPPFSLTISPPASLTNKALKELIVSADFGTPPSASRPKRPRSMKTELGSMPRAKAARTTSASPENQENTSGKANAKTTKGKKCIETGCTRRAQSNSRCKAHGGGARCQYSGPGGCNRSSQGGGFCRAHGGGKRCEFPGCTRGQQRKGRCYVHGGIRKCQHGACEKKDRGNGFCISHGGGKRCEHPGCSRAVRRGMLCQIHEAQSTTEEQGESVSL